jgi:hypothetical protein
MLRAGVGRCAAGWRPPEQVRDVWEAEDALSYWWEHPQEAGLALGAP